MIAGLAALAAACGLARAQAPAPAAAASISSSAVAGTYRLDPAHTFATFEVRHFGTSTLRGRFGPLQGEVTVDPAAGTGDVRLRIPMATLSTGFAPLDARLKRPDLLAVDDYPEAYFVATRFRFDAAGGVREVRGEFILRGHSEPLSLYADRFACRDDAMLERRVCGGDFHADLKRGAFGANFGEPFVGDDVHLVIQVEAIAA
ncbi:MAG TPA: YceI family protein [Burkholderiaceae bacterium]